MVPLYPPASRSAITPVFCLSHLISFCHLCAGLFFPSSPYFFAPRSCLFIGALHSTRHVSLLHFYPSSCRSLNPLSFALLCPHPSRFSSCSPEATFACSPFPPTLPVSLILPDSFPICYPFHSSLSPLFVPHTLPFLSTLWLSCLHLIPF